MPSTYTLLILLDYFLKVVALYYGAVQLQVFGRGEVLEVNRD